MATMDIKSLTNSNLISTRRNLKADIEKARSSFNDLEDDNRWNLTPIEERKAENDLLEAEIEEKQALIEEIEAEIAYREKRKRDLIEAYDEKLAKYNAEVAKFREEVIEAFGLRKLEKDFEAIAAIRDELNNVSIEANKCGMMRIPPRYKKMGTLLIDVLKGD